MFDMFYLKTPAERIGQQFDSVVDASRRRISDANGLNAVTANDFLNSSKS